MKRVLLFVVHFFKKPKTFEALFSEAVAEGIRDTMLEMGYRFEAKKKDTDKSIRN